MSRDIKYIGMDVHQEAIVIAVLNGSGKLVMETIVETKASSILQFIQGLRGELHVTWEEGTWAAWLYDLLQPQVTQVLTNLTSFWHNLNRRHRGVAGDRNELQQQLALCVRYEAGNLSYQRMVLSRFLKNIQIREDCLPITENVEYAISIIAESRQRGGLRWIGASESVAALDEVQCDRISARSNRNRI